MITCHIRYTIDPYEFADFERYAGAWIPLVNRPGGEHHGFFLPQEGANDVAAFGLFSSLRAAILGLRTHLQAVDLAAEVLKEKARQLERG